MQKIDLIRIYQRKTALVIDDFTDMRGTIRRMLSNFGLAAIDVAGTGEEAIARCEQRHYDIILSDYNLGEGKNGQQILEELRHRELLRHGAIYVMVTAETTRAMVFGALEYQPDDYLTKPFTQPVLQQRLDRLVIEKETLREVNEALDRKDYRAAIGHCDDHIVARDRYAQRCLHLKAICYEKLRDFAAAETIYQAAQAERPLEWARIGLGKCLLARGALNEAEQIFQTLIDERSLCLEVYDNLAEIKCRRGDVATAQQLLEHASDISPNAILRQQMLAEISEANGDWERAEKAHRRVLRLEANSCYESPENFLKMARCISTAMRATGDRLRLKEVKEVLERGQRRYRDNPEVTLQSAIILAAARADAGNETQARSSLETIASKIAAAAESPSPAVILELARAWQTVGEAAVAQQLLADLAARFPEDQALLEVIDRTADEPLSNEGKERAVALNGEGRKLLADSQFAKAVQLFGEALRIFPNNNALKLNLLLALIQEMTTNGVRPELLQRADATAAAVKGLGADHPLHDRLALLRAHLDRLRAAA
ncbi:MAG: response regulator [Spongiibacteraceae bacterium]|jgi:CheY-like chemotaxis protein/Flp pilus assembly protein TadD|nr:response regulator [Spongiibacteraceae bacterium]